MQIDLYLTYKLLGTKHASFQEWYCQNLIELVLLVFLKTIFIWNNHEQEPKGA